MSVMDDEDLAARAEVPLDRQRHHLREAQQRLVEDTERRLEEWQEQERREKRAAELQRVIDFHMEMKLANEEAERRFMRELDPWNLGIYGVEPFHKV
jgi:hypothetical protein